MELDPYYRWHTQKDQGCLNVAEPNVNTNDCPIELARDSALKIKKKYNNIDMLLVGYAGASCWPQCIEYTPEQLKNAIKEKKQRYLTMAEEYIKLFNPKFFMPFAGRYILSGKMADLNFKRGEPELEEAYDFLSSRFDQKNKAIVLNVNGYFDITTGKANAPYNRIDPKQKENYIKNIKSGLDTFKEANIKVSGADATRVEGVTKEAELGPVKGSTSISVILEIGPKILVISYLQGPAETDYSDIFDLMIENFSLAG